MKLLLEILAGLIVFGVFCAVLPYIITGIIVVCSVFIGFVAVVVTLIATLFRGIGRFFEPVFSFILKPLQKRREAEEKARLKGLGLR